MATPKYPDWNILGRDAETIARLRAANEASTQVPSAASLPADAQLHAALAELLGGTIIGAIDALTQSAGDARYQLRVPSIFDDGQVSGAVTLDWLKGTTHRITLVGNVTSLTIANLPVGSALTLEVNTGAGGFTLAGGDWDTVLWFGGEPTISTAANTIDRFRFDRTAAGILGVVEGQGAAVPPVTPPDTQFRSWVVGDSLAKATATRPTTATYRTSDGRVSTAGLNTPRDNHFVGSQRTLLLERSAVNLMPATEALDQAPYSLHRTTIVANAVVGPDGANSTAERLVEDTTNGTHDLNMGALAGTVDDNTAYTFSMFAKQTSRAWLDLLLEDKAGSDARIWFDLATGTVGTVQAGASTPRLVAHTNSWYRLSAQRNSGAGSVTPDLSITAGSTTGDAVTLFVGDGASGVALVGTQLERGAVSTSYIPNASTTAPANRDADSLSWAWGAGYTDSTGFVRYIDLGSSVENQATIIAVGPADTIGQQVVIQSDGVGGFLLTYDNGQGVASLSNLALGVQVGNDVRLRWRLMDDGTGALAAQLFGSIGGGAEVAGTIGTHAPAPSNDGKDRFVWLNSNGPFTPGLIGLIGWQIKDGDLALAAIDNTVGGGVPAAPTGLTTTPNGTTMQVRWTDVPGLTYNVYRKFEQGGFIDPDWVLITSTPLAVASYDDTLLAQGATYHYIITALNAVGESLPSPEASATIGAAANPPAQPTSLQASAASATRIDLTWVNNAIDATGNEVHRSQTAGFTPDTTGGTTRVASIAANATTYSDQTVAAQQTYFYRIVAVNGAGPSLPSNEASATTPAAPAGDATYSNRPGTVPTVVTDADWSILNPSGWLNNGLGNVTVITDATAPKSPPSVMQVTYPQGFTEGGAPVTLYNDAVSGGTTEIFVGMHWKYSTGWEYHSSGVNKISHQFYSSAGGEDVFSMHGLSDTSAQIVFTFENSNQEAHGGTTNYFANVGNSHVVPGQWYKLEYWYKCSTPGAQDGALKVWVNGVLTHDYTNIPTVDKTIIEFQISPTWGGNNSPTTHTKSHTDFYWFDHTFIAKN